MRIEIQWFGQSCFQITYGSWSCVLDPYRFGSVPGLAPLNLSANCVYSSHSHDDHTGFADVHLDSSQPMPADVSMEEFTCAHDSENGEKLGVVTARVFSFGGLRLAHLGDIGSMPSDELFAAISNIDVLMLPVGGVFTIDAATAKKIMDRCNPRVVLPMHYRTETYGVPLLDTLEPFLSICGPVQTYDASTIEVSEDTPAQIAILRV